MYKIALFATACTLAAVAAFDPITVVAGTTSYVLTGTQVAVAVASLGALALAAEGLLLAELSRGRGRRSRTIRADSRRREQMVGAPATRRTASPASHRRTARVSGRSR